MHILIQTNRCRPTNSARHKQIDVFIGVKKQQETVNLDALLVTALIMIRSQKPWRWESGAFEFLHLHPWNWPDPRPLAFILLSGWTVCLHYKHLYTLWWRTEMFIHQVRTYGLNKCWVSPALSESRCQLQNDIPTSPRTQPNLQWGIKFPIDQISDFESYDSLEAL